MGDTFAKPTHGSRELGSPMRLIKPTANSCFNKSQSECERRSITTARTDIQRSNEANESFRERQQEQEEQFNRIQSVIGCHVQLGTLAGEGSRRRQKEVDILLTVDMMNHAIRQNMSHAYLLAGDRDFRPVVKSLVDMGIFVIVRADIRDSAPDLIRAADGFEELKFSHYYGWTPEPIRIKYPVPETTAGTRPPALPLLRKGYAGNQVVLIYQNGNRVRRYFPDGQTLRDCDNVDRLLTYLQLEFGEFVDDDSV